MGINTHNISSGQYIQIVPNMIICDIITSSVGFLALSITKGISGDRL